MRKSFETSIFYRENRLKSLLKKRHTNAKSNKKENAYRKSKNDSECSPRIDSGMERRELWYMSNVSRNGKPVTSSGSSQSRFRDKSKSNREQYLLKVTKIAS